MYELNQNGKGKWAERYSYSGFLKGINKFISEPIQFI
jgi:hypothetical protein